MITLSYCLWMAASIAVCGALFTRMAKKELKRIDTALLGTVLAVVFGAIGAKLLYYLSQINFVIVDGLLEQLYDMSADKWGVFGGAAGASLGIILAARITKERPVKALDTFAPAALLMIAAARFGCFFLQESMVGWGKYVQNEALCFFPLTVVNEWQEYYWAVFMLETLTALVLMAVCLLKLKEKRFVRSMFYLALTQVFCESLHTDSISWLFVRVEQLGCAIVLFGVLLYYALQLKPRKGWFTAPGVCLGVIAVCVGVEFALDKSSWPIPLIYAVMIISLAVLGVTEVRTFRQLKKN